MFVLYVLRYLAWKARFIVVAEIMVATTKQENIQFGAGITVQDSFDWTLDFPVSVRVFLL